MRDSSVEELRPLYERLSSIAVVGCSTDRVKPANFVPRYLRAYGYRIVPVNPFESEILGERCYASLRELPEPVDVVQVFRPSAEAPGIAREAVATGAGCLWLQLEVESDEAGRIATEGGLTFVTDRCMGVVHGQLGLGPGLHSGDWWHRGLDPSPLPSADDQPLLRLTSGAGTGRTIPTDRELTIGREADGPGRIADDLEISREHARVSRTRHDQVMIADLGSTNGVYVNAMRVDEHVLGVGDIVRIGNTTLVLELPGEDGEAARARSATAVRPAQPGAAPRGPRVPREDELIEPWFDHLIGETPLVDIHTHIGHNDPDGFSLSAADLLARLERAGSRGAAMPMQEPDGYAAANDAVLEACERSDERLVPFCRVDPARDGLAEVRRCLEAGARGIKLHPRAEGFALSDPEVAPLFALAHERRLAVLVHAGRGIPTLARDAIELAGRHPEARIVLAHAAICDLNWLWRELPRHPNLYVDTSWWNPVDLAALIALVPPGHLLYATDLPYFTPFMVAPMVARFAYQAGLDERQVAGVLGGQAERVLAGQEPLDLGPAPGSASLGTDIRLERLSTLLMLAIARMLMGRTGWEPLSLARLACELDDPDTPEAAVCRNVLALLERQELLAREDRMASAPFGPGIRIVMLAACIARTPAVELPRLPELEDRAALRRASSAGHRVVEDGAGRSSGADHRLVDRQA